MAGIDAVREWVGLSVGTQPDPETGDLSAVWQFDSNVKNYLRLHLGYIATGVKCSLSTDADDHPVHRVDFIGTSETHYIEVAGDPDAIETQVQIDDGPLPSDPLSREAVDNERRAAGIVRILLGLQRSGQMTLVDQQR